MAQKQRRLKIETLEDRVVLNAAPVLVRELYHANQLVSWRAWTDKSSHVDLSALGSPSISDNRIAVKHVHDFTGDDVEDVLVQWPDGSWDLQVNDGQRLYTLPRGNNPTAASTFVDAADFNGDGLDDILSYDKTTGDMWVSLNSMENGFTNERWTKFTPKTEWLHLFVDDFDGDGLVDVLGGESGGGWWLAKNKGTTFHNFFWGRFGRHQWQDVVSDDFTGDGLPDVAARGTDNTWWMWEGTNGKLRHAQYWGHWKMRDEWFDVSVADFNNDGHSDLIGRSEDGYLWIGNGGDKRLKTSPRAKGWLHQAEWTNVGIVDMNGDGLLDHVAQAKDSTWWYAENRGERFQNHYWQKGDGFVSSNFTRDVAVDLSPVFDPGGVRQQSVVTSEVSLTLDEHDRIVLVGAGIDLLGVQFESKSGSLVPVTRGTLAKDIATAESVGQDKLAAPFQLFVSNDPHRVTLGSLGSTFRLDGSITLNVGWDTSGVQDLIGIYGGYAAPKAIDVDDRLEAESVFNDYLDNNHRLYRRLV